MARKPRPEPKSRPHKEKKKTPREREGICDICSWSNGSKHCHGRSKGCTCGC